MRGFSVGSFLEAPRLPFCANQKEALKSIVRQPMYRPKVIQGQRDVGGLPPSFKTALIKFSSAQDNYNGRKRSAENQKSK